MAPHQVVTRCPTVMITIPIPPVAEGDEEEVAALQRLQPFAAARKTSDRLAQWPVQPFEDGSAQQEVANGCGLALQHFLRR